MEKLNPSSGEIYHEQRDEVGKEVNRHAQGQRIEKGVKYQKTEGHNHHKGCGKQLDDHFPR